MKQKLSLTLEGGLGDFILRYLGSPGDRVSGLLRVSEIELRVSESQKAGRELVRGNPFFDNCAVFKPRHGMRDRLKNDISLISNLDSYPRIPIPLWLDGTESEVFYSLKRPYAVYHPYASHPARQLAGVFDLHALAQWIADYANIRLLVLGTEKFGYHSENVIDMTGIGSPRLACKIIENATFFVGTHSSLQCAASVYSIPSVCLGPSHLLFHDFSSPYSYHTYLKPMFVNGSVFMMLEDASHFMTFFEHFVESATSLSPNKDPELFRRRLTVSGMASGKTVALSDISLEGSMDHNPNFRCLDVSEPK